MTVIVVSYFIIDIEDTVQTIPYRNEKKGNQSTSFLRLMVPEFAQ
jgi:hypothetical protein